MQDAARHAVDPPSPGGEVGDPPAEKERHACYDQACPDGAMTTWADDGALSSSTTPSAAVTSPATAGRRRTALLGCRVERAHSYRADRA